MTIRQSPDPTRPVETGQNGPASDLNPALADIDLIGPLNGPQGRLPASRLPLPTREQLLILVERAGRSLQPVEAAVLRRGVDHLGEQLVLAGASLRQLGADLERARAELDVALRELGSVGPLSVPCSFCGAPVAARCRAVRGVEPPRTPHTARLHAAARAGGVL
jgi:hypothetical protein